MRKALGHTRTHTHIYTRTYARRKTYIYISTRTHKVREKTRKKGYFGIIKENGTFSIGQTFFQPATFPSCFLLLKRSIMIDRKRIVIFGKNDFSSTLPPPPPLTPLTPSPPPP